MKCSKKAMYNKTVKQVGFTRSYRQVVIRTEPRLTQTEEAKVMFVIFRRSDLTRDECLEQWNGERHGTVVRKTSGLRKWTQNHVVSEEGERMPDGIGELWFDHMDAVQVDYEFR